MRAWLRITLWTLVAIAIAAGVAYWWLILAGDGEPGQFRLDIAELRAAANEVAGDKPVEVRVEHVGSGEMPLAFTRSAAGWEASVFPYQSYQIVRDGRPSIILETAYDEEAAKQSGATFFDREAFGRVLSAMAQAEAIVVTHEHMDHMGGLVTAKDLDTILPRAVLNKEQLTSDVPFAAKLPKEAQDRVKPLEYDGLHALAPGVVLIKARGHTPGSQMVFVQRADGKEYLFLGDVSWKMANIDLVRERPRLATYVIGEDRVAVLAQMAAIKALKDANPALHIMPGHDMAVLDTALKDGWLIKGFK